MSNPKMLFESEEEFVKYMERENPRKLTPVYHLADALKANMAWSPTPGFLLGWSGLC